jgi:hypothetical protein
VSASLTVLPPGQATAGGGGQALGAPLVEATVVTNAPVLLGHRPYVVPAWLLQEYESTSTLPPGW